jgi:hypothetical protein
MLILPRSPLLLLGVLPAAASFAALPQRLPAPAAPRLPDPIVVRFEPRLNDVVSRVTITSWSGNPYAPAGLSLPPSELGMSLIADGPASRIDLRSLAARVWLDDTELPDAGPKGRLLDGIAEGNRVAAVALPQFVGQSIRWETSYRVETFNVRVDEARAAQVTWPREWPKELARFLQSEPCIEGDDPRIQQFVQRVSEGRLREVPPFIAAKELVRAATLLPTSIVGSGVVRQGLGAINGIDVRGASSLIASGVGTPADVVCLAVATLRAAGIPARPVLGVTRYDSSVRKFQIRGGNGPWVWGEFWIPQAGWIPFDPAIMRRQALPQAGIRTAWKGFASFDDLHAVIPMAWSFVPPPPLQLAGYPAMWGSSLAGLITPISGAPVEQRIAYIDWVLTNRGPGIGDP